ncbi:MAG: glycosyltransferase family 2 protein [Thermodesulfobacteriota bacterium]
MDISVVTTLYYSEPYINEFYERISGALQSITNDYEIVFVNDGSPDNSLGAALGIHEKDSRVKIVDLSRNFGHHKAVMTGLSLTTGDLVFLIDIDLEEEPELLNKCHEVFKKTNDVDVVYCVQEKRKGKLFERISGSAYYFLFNLLSSNYLPPNLIMARLMTRKYVQALIMHKESEVELGGIYSITGFKQISLTVKKGSKDKTTYTLRKKLSLTIKSITGFSNRPLIYIAVLGAFILFLSFLYALYVFLVRVFVGEAPSGYMTIVLSIWFLGGLTIFSIGVIAIYLSVIFTEVKNRPYTIIKNIYQKK